MKIMEIYHKLLEMIYLNNYCTDFMFVVVIVCATYSSTISSHNFQFPFSIQDITLVFF